MTRALAVLATVGAALLAGAAASAGTGSGNLEVSRDGITWAASLTDPLFDPAILWAPGDVRTETVWVRNQSADGAILTIDVTATDSGNLLATDSVTIQARLASQVLPAVSGAGTQRIVPDTPLAAGAALAVDVSVELAFDAPNAAQRRWFEFELVATLTAFGDDPSEVPLGASTTTTTTTSTTSTTVPRAQPPGPTMPTTATPAAVPLTGLASLRPTLLAGGFLVTTGVLTTRAARRRHDRA